MTTIRDEGIVKDYDSIYENKIIGVKFWNPSQKTYSRTTYQYKIKPSLFIILRDSIALNKHYVISAEGCNYSNSRVRIESILNESDIQTRKPDGTEIPLKFLDKLVFVEYVASKDPLKEVPFIWSVLKRKSEATEELFKKEYLSQQINLTPPITNEISAKKPEDVSIQDTFNSRAYEGVLTRSDGTSIPIKSPKLWVPSNGDYTYTSPYITTTSNSISINNKPNYEPIKEKENNNMFTKLFKDFTIGKVTGGKVKISPLGLAFRTNEPANPQYLAFDPKTQDFTDVSDMVFDDLNNFIYSIPVSKKDVRTGDYIFHNGSPVRVVGKNERGGLVVQNFFTKEERTILPVKNLFGFDFYSKIVSMAEGLFTGVGEDSPFGNILPFILMKEGGSTSDMLPLMMMMQGGNLDMSNPLMMMMMLKDGNNDMLQSIMMMQMMQGGNSFTNLFGGNTPATPTTSAETETSVEEKTLGFKSTKD